MKNRFLFLFGLAALLGACQPEADPLIGRWTVDKVNVQFDERMSTPELVKQIGEMERQNTFSISTDSTLVFKGLETTVEGRLSLINDSTLLINGTHFGTWKNGRIVMRTGSPLGEVVVTYKKE